MRREQKLILAGAVLATIGAALFLLLGVLIVVPLPDEAPKPWFE